MESAAAPVAVFPVGAAIGLRSHAVAPNQLRAVYATVDELVCIDREGSTLWRLGFGPGAQEPAMLASAEIIAVAIVVAWPVGLRLSPLRSYVVSTR